MFVDTDKLVLYDRVNLNEFKRVIFDVYDYKWFVKYVLTLGWWSDMDIIRTNGLSSNLFLDIHVAFLKLISNICMICMVGFLEIVKLIK